MWPTQERAADCTSQSANASCNSLFLSPPSHSLTLSLSLSRSLFCQDGTLVVTKSGKQFPQDAGDWRFWNPKVVKELKKLHKDGYKVVIFT